MRKTVQLSFVLLVLWLLMLACNLSAPQPTATPILPTVTFIDPAPVEPTATEPVVQPPALSFEAATFQDINAGFEFDYPATWVSDGSPIVVGDRGYIAQITSWERQPNVLPDEIPADGIYMEVSVLMWDPQNALDDYINQRKIAWDASGFTIVQEEELLLPNDWRAVQFQINTSEGQTSYFLITTLDTRYLVLSGSGDMDLLAEMAGTLRPITP